MRVYIRSEDIDKWNAIEKKAQWLHEALNGSIHPNADEIYVDKGLTKEAPIRNVGDMVAEDEEEERWQNYRDEVEPNLKAIPGEKNKALDTVNDEYVKIKWVDGVMRLVK